MNRLEGLSCSVVVDEHDRIGFLDHGCLVVVDFFVVELMHQWEDLSFTHWVVESFLNHKRCFLSVKLLFFSRPSLSFLVLLLPHFVATAPKEGQTDSQGNHRHAKVQQSCSSYLFICQLLSFWNTDKLVEQSLERRDNCDVQSSQNDEHVDGEVGDLRDNYALQDQHG